MTMSYQICLLLIVMTTLSTLVVSQTLDPLSSSPSPVPTFASMNATTIMPTEQPSTMPTEQSSTSTITTLRPSTPPNTTLAPSESASLSDTSTPLTSPPSDFLSSTPSLGPTQTVLPPASDAPTNATVTSKPSSNSSPSPSAAPTTISPSKRPIRSPSRKPTRSKTDQPTPLETTENPTVNPTIEPSPRPTTGGSRVRTLITGISLSFSNVADLSTQEFTEFEDVTDRWFNEYFNNNTRRRLLLRALQGSEGISRMFSTVKVIGQSSSSGNNIIYYNQSLDYYATKNASNASEIIVLPFENVIANSDYASRLSANIPAFVNVDSPITNPALPGPEPTPDSKDGGLSLAVIIGIAVGGAVFCALLLFLGMRSMNSDKDGTGYVDSGSLPPTQFNINAAEEISVIDDPTVAKMGSGNMSVGQYGDQSVATVDYDYSKAYGGGGNESVVSSVGGTLGDNTRQTAGDVAANSARLALGANFESDLQNEFKEEIIVIDAPAGKLGVVIDTPDDGAPVVHAVKDSSVIADQIQVGDKLIAVDDDDVRSMTAIKVSKLISKKSANPSRKLTIVRQIHVDHR